MSSHSSPQRCFIVEGNIGAGKSTFLRLIHEQVATQAVFEPHEKWQHVTENGNLLEKFYNDTQRWAYTFQSYAFITRIMAQQEHAKRNIYATQVLERSVYSDRYCFAKNCFELGVMNALEWKLYQETFEWLVENYTTRPAGFIYLKTDPEICYQRLVKRSRAEEVGVSREYLQMLHDKHEAWLIEKAGIAEYLKDVPVLVLDCDKDFESDAQERDAHIAKVREFIGQTAAVNPVENDVSSISL